MSVLRSVYRVGVAAGVGRQFSSLSGLAGQHVISAKQFDRKMVEKVLRISKEMENAVTNHGGTELLRGKVAHTLFYEPSTRTRVSFETAMMRMGGSVCSISSENSSHQKGETLEDTIMMLDKYSDAIVIRHPMNGAAKIAADVSTKPILNGGDGTGEHPTQALLDTYCIQRELGRIDGLTITLLGDLKNGRTVHSLFAMLSLFDVKRINLVAPTILRMPEYIRNAVKGVDVHETDSLDSVIGSSDVTYVTRVQKERFADLAEYEKLKSHYIINPAVMSKAPSKSIIMHPLPRVTEIETAVDKDPRAAYFRQAQCGMYVRMALLGAVMGKL